MNRPAAVIVTIVLLSLGGIFCAAMSAVMVFSFMVSPPPQTPEVQANPALFRLAMIFVAGFFGLLGVWQLCTAVGLWRLKPWARLSLVTFAGLMVTFQATGMLMLFFLPFPPGAPDTEQLLMAVRIFLFAFYAITAAIGTWWLVYFTRPRVKALFSLDGVAPPPSPQPQSIVIIGWLLVTTAAVWPFAVYWQMPAIVFWKVFTGSTAAWINTIWLVVTLYAGVGLLRWKLSGYYTTLALYAFGGVNALLFWLLPGASDRSREILAAMPILVSDQAAAQAMPSPIFSVVMALSGIGLPLYFLLTRKAKFVAMSQSRQATQS